MIQKSMMGRLGNQMLQYASMRAFMEKNNDFDLRLDYNTIAKRMGDKNELVNFNVVEYKEIDKIHYTIVQKLTKKIIEKIIYVFYNNKDRTGQINFERKISPWLQKIGYYRMIYGYTDLENSKCKNKIFEGYFESHKYFDDIKDILLKEFEPRHDRLEKNIETYRRMEENESVCISIRRGDYLKSENKALQVCTINYYKKAIAKILELKPNAKFFVFSDDIEWVKENLNFSEDTYFESGNDPVWETLRLMYSCKNFIISNSTFNWWGQYLSRSKDKIVIAPSKWKNTFDDRGLYEEDWILIEP